MVDEHMYHTVLYSARLAPLHNTLSTYTTTPKPAFVISYLLLLRLRDRTSRAFPVALERGVGVWVVLRGSAIEFTAQPLPLHLMTASLEGQVFVSTHDACSERLYRSGQRGPVLRDYEANLSIFIPWLLDFRM